MFMRNSGMFSGAFGGVSVRASRKVLAASIYATLRRA